MTKDPTPPVHQEEEHREDVSQARQDSATIGDQQAKLEQLEKQLADMTAIAKRAQSDYITLKMDFDGYVSRNDSQKEHMKEDNLISLVKRLIPVFTTLKQMVQTVPAELAENTRAQGVTLTYGKLLTELDSLAIKSISPSIGTDPDLHLHLPLWSEESDPTLHGKITKVLEDGYVYTWKDREVVIIPAKVVVGK